MFWGHLQIPEDSEMIMVYNRVFQKAKNTFVKVIGDNFDSLILNNQLVTNITSEVNDKRIPFLSKLKKKQRTYSEFTNNEDFVQMFLKSLL